MLRHEFRGAQYVDVHGAAFVRLLQADTRAHRWRLRRTRVAQGVVLRGVHWEGGGVTRTCRICHAKYTPVRPLQPCCENFSCKVAYATRAAEKAHAKRIAEANKALKVRKEAAKRRGDLMAEAQTAFNAFIRWRDRNATCICCGKSFEPQKAGGSMDCGHYLSRGSAPHLRFNEDNAFGQRKNCNRPGGTTRAAFRAGVIARIGLERVEAIEADQSSRKWSLDDLRAIRDEYRRKLRDLKAGSYFGEDVGVL